MPSSHLPEYQAPVHHKQSGLWVPWYQTVPVLLHSLPEWTWPSFLLPACTWHTVLQQSDPDSVLPVHQTSYPPDSWIPHHPHGLPLHWSFQAALRNSVPPPVLHNGYTQSMPYKVMSPLSARNPLRLCSPLWYWQSMLLPVSEYPSQNGDRRMDYSALTYWNLWYWIPSSGTRSYKGHFPLHWPDLPSDPSPHRMNASVKGLVL